ncbi:hypothetical protein C7999DRAFT_35667 [Corynascus novoguineensis]|uniref:Uncharacterized protein n=1 Tax=Corynascus novoguineensis TaxID=1126955 RepID=A0AAN7CKZ4_9PEZI|nr:hypothetical protein C7999DRAFT_35667 [Corynascus novoguineensis]
MPTIAPLTSINLGPWTYTKDLDPDLTEHLQRYTIIHKLDHGNHSLSWLARDNAARAWRRIDIVHAAPDVSVHIQRRVNAQLRERDDAKFDGRSYGSIAEAKGMPLSTFFHRGPNGRHLYVMFPLNGATNCFRWGLKQCDRVEMNEAWFVRECARLRAADGNAVAPVSVHELTAREMLAILGRPRLVEVTGELWEQAFGPDEHIQGRPAAALSGAAPRSHHLRGLGVGRKLFGCY